jgi:hypothetical protein
MTDDTPSLFDLSAVRRKKFTVGFSGGNQSSDGGLLHSGGRHPLRRHLAQRLAAAPLRELYCGPVLRHPAELMLPAVDLGGRVWLGGKPCVE